MTTGAAPVPSPCINVCRMDQGSGWCTGCLRTLDEIACWSGLDDAAKSAVWQRLPARRAQARRLRKIAAGAGPQTPESAA